jgi:hypothetical protein
MKDRCFLTFGMDKIGCEMDENNSMSDLGSRTTDIRHRNTEGASL